MIEDDNGEHIFAKEQREGLTDGYPFCQRMTEDDEVASIRARHVGFGKLGTMNEQAKEKKANRFGGGKNGWS